MKELFKDIKLTPGYKDLENHNPILMQRFGADPFAMEYNGRVYVYTTHDVFEYDSEGKLKENTYATIRTLNCISSDDLINWTDHGVIQVAGPKGASGWASNSWAPAAAHKTIDGKEKFFLYYANNASTIGVLTSDSPVGPWSDPLGKPIITRETENCSDVAWLFDPAVFVDDDGKAYLYFGGGVPKGKEAMPNTARAVELGEDMISLAGTPVVIEAPYLFEDSGINKIGDTYYYSYCSNWSSRDNAVGLYVPKIAEIIIMTSKNPLGPWTYKGSILENPGVFFEAWSNNHHSMIKFKDKWYMFYHSLLLCKDMSLPASGYRTTNVDEVIVSSDGTIKPIIGTRTGVKQVKNFDPFIENEAETFAWMGGITTKAIEGESKLYGKTNLAVNVTETGDWIGISNVDFGATGADCFTAKVSSMASGNAIKICLDNPESEAIGYLEVPNTGSENIYKEVTAKINKVQGVHNLFFIFAGKEFQFDSWKFEKSR
jgi:arabinoxylan arabinofuranohydrolase